MKNIQHLLIITLLIANCSLLIANCSFDYGDLEPVESTLPDLVMQNVEYTRVRSAEPIARFQADRAERYEVQSVMKLENVSFEQFGETVEEVNAMGTITNAVIEIDTGDILMENGVRIEVESEDIILETQQLEWKDETKILTSWEEEEVSISMNNGTNIIGTGLYADTRKRVWEFAGKVSGVYFEEDIIDEEEPLLEAKEEDEVTEEIDETV